jgi:hypothetical protein
MIDALIKRVSVTYKCYEMYAHRGEYIGDIKNGYGNLSFLNGFFFHYFVHV